jgi:hypothetical protein
LRGKEPHLNLKGFIIANGAIDYNFDPHVSSVEMLLNYGIIPLWLYNEYIASGCFVQWTWFYSEYLKELPDSWC